jgi:hypothetical protein
MSKSTVGIIKVIIYKINSAIAGPKPGWERGRGRSNNLLKKTRVQLAPADSTL